MTVLETAIMPDGTEIQIEDWTKDYSCYKTISIAAYPIAKNTGKYKWVLGGERFRLTLNSSYDGGWISDEEVRSAFSDLIKGTKKLEDFAGKFWNGDKDKWYLGMDVEYQGW